MSKELNLHATIPYSGVSIANDICRCIDNECWQAQAMEQQ